MSDIQAKPGDREFCGTHIDNVPCFHWRHYERRAVPGLGANSHEILPGDGVLRCRHPEARKGFCPIDEEERGGDA